MRAGDDRHRSGEINKPAFRSSSLIAIAAAITSPVESDSGHSAVRHGDSL
jgi:hypothetical protein